MIKAMNTITNNISYPIFTPNQVLTKDDLNQLVNYLDEQNRFTRAYLIGTGIVCGMELSSTYQTAQAQIQISAGCGITSEGYIISVSATTLTHYQIDQLVSDALFAATPKSDEVSATPPQNYKVIELFEQSGNYRVGLHQAPDGTTRDATAFQNFLSNQVLVVVSEIQDVQYDSCLLDFDKLSKERSFNLRFFLLPRSGPDTEKDFISANTLLARGYQIEQFPEPWKQFVNQYGTPAVFETSSHFLQEFDLEIKNFKDFAPKVQRFGYVAAEQKVDLTKISDYTTFRENYYLVCTNAIAAIDNAFPKLFQLFSPFFSSFHPASNNDFAQLKQHLEKLLASFQNQETTVSLEKVEVPEAPYTLQYFYDYLSQLVAAYYELAEAAFDLMDDCTPDTRRFPKFLLLGTIPNPNQGIQGYAATSAYRSQFTQPPIYNANQLRLKQVRHLYERLLNLCQPDSFYLLPFYNTPLKITPSKDRSATLSQQAIPYYLNYPKVYRYWSYDAYRKGRSDQHPAYFLPNNVLPRNKLVYRLDGYNFYRIEGHIGKATSNALKRIQEYQQQYNLPFDVITLKCGSLSSFQDLNVSGQIDDLETEFGRLKDKFQKLWNRNQEWSQNVFLNTLKRVFFDQPHLAAIADTQLVNPILELTQSMPAYEFEAQTDGSNPPSRYHLFLKNNAGIRIARYVFQNEAGNPIEFLDFSGLTAEQITQEQQRIIQDLSAYLTLGTVTYGVERQSPSNPMSYQVRLSVTDELDLPINAATNEPRGKAAIELISLNYFSVTLENNLPIINQSEFQDFETLYSLLRDVPENYASENNLNFKMGDRLAADSLGYFELKDLIETYRQRLKRLMELHLFHKFAQQHPGMEHLGGVPKGGTFILVYVDGQEVEDLLAADKNSTIYQLQTLRTAAIQKGASLPPAAPEESINSWELLLKELQKRKDIVVADFCLPYRCSSDTAAVSYVLARPRPIVLLEQTDFCEGDTKEYEFILEPEGGTLKGEGIFFKGRKHYFKPSNITQEIDSEVAITFTYAVDDTFDTLTVTIYPLPDAGFQIGDESNQTTLCADDAPVSLTPKQAGGSFRVLVGEQDISADALDTQSNVPQLILSAIQLGDAEQLQVIIEYTITNENGCTNRLQQQVMIFALPDANFQIGDESNPTTFAANDPPVSLIPKQAGGNFRALVGERDISADALDTESHPPQFVPSGVDLGDAEQLQVTIQYTITSDKGCTNQSQQQVTIFALPDADFQVGDESNQTTFAANDPPISLTPKQAGGNFRALVGERDISADALDTQSHSQLIPSAVNLGDAKQLQVTIEYTITNDKGFTNRAQQQITIFALPDADFQFASVPNQTTFAANAAPISLTPKQAGGNFRVLAGEQDIAHALNTQSHPPQLIPSAVNLGNAEQLQVTIEYTITDDNRTNRSQQQITIFALPNADFQVSGVPNKTIFCANEPPISLTPKQAGGNFRILVGEQDISAAALNTQSEPPQLILNAVPLGDAEQLQIAIEYTISNDNGDINQSIQILTVHRVPVGDFQAEIANIHTQGFSVRVFDIQPTGETSFNFVWEHPGGSKESISGSSEFIINYSYDFDRWVTDDEVPITLRIDTPASLGSCSSEPITKRIAIPFGGVLGVNLLTISNNVVINRTLVERDVFDGLRLRTFKLSDFNPNNQYSFEALTVPETIGSVVFTYTDPANNERVLPAVNTTPYQMPDRWQPLVGIHKIKVQAFKEVNGVRVEGTDATVIFRINDSEPNTDTPTNPESPTLLNRLRLILPTGKEITIAKANKSLVNFYHRASNEYKLKLTQVMAMSAIALLFLLGWGYSSSRQPRNQMNSAPPSKPITSSELMN
ncbi:hypothetical protein [Dendronalium sp. ChiSLP03b]|uniref:hypothetical protein n=1 Tax=Dendronalium sp. ChiSLP03b TaxID=3075381 RepID=UPI002AD55F3C|nr:hypothetical protein [Dendronalium sp. ChiSLP03b]MDZ8203791.1 hypothetical protein [Dendronalium sp. ChiSLP03b]